MTAMKEETIRNNPWCDDMLLSRTSKHKMKRKMTEKKRLLLHWQGDHQKDQNLISI